MLKHLWERFLGWLYTPDNLGLSDQEYALELLAEFWFLGWHSTETVIDNLVRGHGHTKESAAAEIARWATCES